MDVKKIGRGVLTALKVARLGRSDGVADVVRGEARVAAAHHEEVPYPVHTQVSSLPSHENFHISRKLLPSVNRHWIAQDPNQIPFWNPLVKLS